MDLLTFLIQVIASFVGTVAFAVLFGIPRKYYLMCGIVAALGWILYLVLGMASLTSTECIFFSTILVVLLSRIAAVWQSCPVTVFLTCGIFPLIPGGGIYWTAYYLVMDEPSLAASHGFAAIKAVVAIVLGIVIVLEMPNKLFRIFSRR